MKMDPISLPIASLLEPGTQEPNLTSYRNFTDNGTLVEPSISRMNSVLISIIYLLVCAIGLSGNTLVIYVVLRYAKMKTVTNIYILNLAVADVLFMLGLPFLATQNAISYWPFGTFLCRLVMTVDGINQFTSIFCLTVMSIDRYLAVVHPIRSTKWRRPRVAKLISATVWTVSFLVVLPVIIFSDVQQDLNTCNINWPEPVNIWSTAFIIYTSVLGFFGPLLVICLCYLLIVIKVKSTGLRVGSTRRRRSERKVTRMVVIIVAVFVFCWLPFYILNIVNLTFIVPEEPAYVGVYFFVVVLSYANSCANPILYGFLSDNFKQSFQKVLCLRKSNGIKDADLTENRQEKSSRIQETMLTSRNSEFNGHMQTSKVRAPPRCKRKNQDKHCVGPIQFAWHEKGFHYRIDFTKALKRECTQALKPLGKHNECNPMGGNTLRNSSSSHRLEGHTCLTRFTSPSGVSHEDSGYLSCFSSVFLDIGVHSSYFPSGMDVFALPTFDV